MAVHCLRHGSDSGGDQPHFPCSLDKSSGGTTPPMVVTRRCTVLTVVVYTGHAGATPNSAAPRLSPGGHRPRGGGATGHGDGAPPEHLQLGLLNRSPPQGGGAPSPWCPHGSTLSPTTPPFLHLFHHLCKCANTPSVSPSRASVLAFLQLFFKGYSLITDCALGRFMPFWYPGEWPPYDGPKYIADPAYHWSKHGSRKRMRHRMVMDQIPGRTRRWRVTPFLTYPEQYECGKCGRLGHNSRTCRWQISDVQLVVVSIISNLSYCFN
jgi:hypothetical protein